MPSGTSLSTLVDVALEVAVLGVRAGLHRAERAHAAVLLVALALQNTTSPGLSSTPASSAAEHHGVGARGDRLGDVARELDAAVGDDRDAVPAAACAQS